MCFVPILSAFPSSIPYFFVFVNPFPPELYDGSVFNEKTSIGSDFRHSKSLFAAFFKHGIRENGGDHMPDAVVLHLFEMRFCL